MVSMMSLRPAISVSAFMPLMVSLIKCRGGLKYAGDAFTADAMKLRIASSKLSFLDSITLPSHKHSLN